MGIQKFFKNRYNIIYIIIVFFLFVLGFRMAVLTIVKGEEYRKTADIKKIKDIPVKALRGKIYDRNGVVLADNISSFTVQMYTDQIDFEDFNEISLILSKIFDENGERPIDNFPIVLNTFEYIDEEIENNIITETSILNTDLNKKNPNSLTENLVNMNYYKTAQDKIIDNIKENINEWLDFSYTIYGKDFEVKERAFSLLKKDIIDLPIILNDGKFEFSLEKKQMDIWLEKNKIDKDKQANELVIELLIKQNKYLYNLLSNSKVRKLSYEFLKSKELNQNIKMVEYSFIQDNQYNNIKKELKSKYEEITEETFAKDDFVLLTMRYSIDNLLKTVYETKTKKLIVGDMLNDELKQVYEDLPVRCKAENEFVIYEYTDDNLKNKYLDQFHLDTTTSAYDLVKELAVKNYDILYNIITDDKVKYYAQIELLKYENPSISIAEWEYTPIRDKRLWINNILKSIDNDKNDYSAEEVFKLLKDKLKLDIDINSYDLRNMLVIRERYKKTNYLSYHPVDLCYGISEKTVAMISERAHELRGINIEIEPIRYYPEKSSASHVLGYLGKISQDYEINKYVVENGYSPDDIIGKTGIEEKFEDYLTGEKGKKTVEVNNVGKTIKSVSKKEPVPGDDLYLTIDINLQKKAEESLKKGLELIRTGGVYESEWGDFIFKDAYKNAESGAIVVLDVKTGETLAMVNDPSYDLNLFTTGISTEDWNSLLNDSKNPLAPKPLYNIALLTAIQPGSTFKMVTALAALEKGVNPNTKVYCAGTMEVGDRNVSCWIYNMFGGVHGYQNMYEAIANSCNFYFYTTVLGENLATHQKHTVKVEVEDIIKIASELGLDSKTGIEIDIPQENSGGVPSVDGKKISIRVYLRLFLEANIERYLMEGYTIDDSMKNEIAEEIISWVDRESLMTRGEVYDNLLRLKLNPDKTNYNKTPLVDIIKYSYLNQAVWTAGDNLNISIGQGSNSYTTLQMANYISIIANGGYRKNVSLVKDLRTYDGKKTDYIVKRDSERIDIKNYDNLKILREGMKLVSEKDSAKPYANFPVTVGSKTGTAQKEGINPETGEVYDDFAWYVAFAPYDDPQIAVACVLFQGGSGRYPTPIVRDVIGEYLKINGQ